MFTVEEYTFVSTIVNYSAAKVWDAYATPIPSRVNEPLRSHHYLPEWHDDIVDDFLRYLRDYTREHNDTIIMLLDKRKIPPYGMGPLLSYLTEKLHDKIYSSYYFNHLLRKTITYNHADDRIILHTDREVPTSDNPQRDLWCQLFVSRLDRACMEWVQPILSSNPEPIRDVGRSIPTNNTWIIIIIIIVIIVIIVIIIVVVMIGRRKDRPVAMGR